VIAPAAPATAGPTAADDGELSCEEALLESFPRSRDAALAGSRPGIRLCLLGDSHMTFLSRAMQRRGVEHVGNMGCEAYSVRELTGVSGFDGTEARYYRAALNEDGHIDCLHGSEKWYDDVLDALLPLI
jgi:hypothetical protein